MTSAVTFKVIGQGYKVMWLSERCWPISGQQKGKETSTLVEGLRTQQAITHNSFKVKPGRLMLRPKVCHIFRTGRPATENAKTGAGGKRGWCGCTGAVVTSNAFYGRPFFFKNIFFSSHFLRRRKATSPILFRTTWLQLCVL